MLDISKLNMCDYELQFDLLECTMNIYGVHNYYVILMCQKKLKCNFINYCGFFSVLFLEEDLSYKKDATKFQNHQTATLQYKAEFAVDRNTTTCMRTDSIGKSSPEINTWWKVDLTHVCSIYSIRILFKNYNGFGLIFFYQLAISSR